MSTDLFNLRARLRLPSQAPSLLMARLLPERPQRSCSSVAG